MAADYFLLGVYLLLSAILSSLFFILYSIYKNRRDKVVIYGSQIKLSVSFAIFGFIFSWYAVSIGFTIYNKWLLNEFHGGFSYPLINTTVHMFMKLVISRIWYYCASNQMVLVNHKCGTLLFAIILIGFCTASDVALSNESILYLNITLYTTLKATVILFTFFWSVVVGVEKFSWWTFSTVLAIAFGVSLAVFSSVEVSVIGIILAVSGSCIAGLRWTLLQHLLTYDPQSSLSPMVALYRFAPYSFLSILPFVCAIDIPRLILAHFTYSSSDTGASDGLDSSQYIGQAFGLMFAGGFIAFFLIILEVQIVQLTSSLTLGVIGQVKEAVQIILAMLIYHDNVTTKGILGIAITLSAAYFYNFLIIRDHKNSTRAHGHDMSPDSRYFRTRKRKPNMSTRKSNRNFKSPLMERFQLFPIIETSNETESTDGENDNDDDEGDDDNDDDEEEEETEDETARFLSSESGRSRLESGDSGLDLTSNSDTTNHNNNSEELSEDHIELITHHHNHHNHQEKHSSNNISSNV